MRQYNADRQPDFPPYSLSHICDPYLDRQDYPGLFQRLKDRFAKDGRFIPVGGAWVEMDSNLVGMVYVEPGITQIH